MTTTTKLNATTLKTRCFVGYILSFSVASQPIGRCTGLSTGETNKSFSLLSSVYLLLCSFIVTHLAD